MVRHFVRLIRSQTVLNIGLPHPYAIAVFQEFMYWDDWSNQAIFRALKSSGGAKTTIKSGVPGIMDLKIFSQDSQKGERDTK